MDGLLKFITVIVAGCLGIGLASLQFHWEPLTMLGFNLVFVSVIVAMGRFDN